MAVLNLRVCLCSGIIPPDIERDPDALNDPKCSLDAANIAFNCVITLTHRDSFIHPPPRLYPLSY